MSRLGIITPHYNNFEGLKKLHLNLLEQTDKDWEWVIIDDFSSEIVRRDVRNYFEANKNISILMNNFKSNAATCRNMGVDVLNSKKMVFLDSDDIISKYFVANRSVDIIDFTVFLNCAVISKNSQEQKAFSNIKHNFLNQFLKAKFAWQTTCILWEKSFFIKIGKFNEQLKLLEDIEVSIRALLISSKNTIKLNNEVDFYYLVEPINIKKRTVKKVSQSVERLLYLILKNHNITNLQRTYLSSYYFLLVKYFCRSSNRANLFYLKKTLNLVKSYKIIGFNEYVLGFMVICLFRYKIISFQLLLKINRKLFKK